MMRLARYAYFANEEMEFSRCWVTCYITPKWLSQTLKLDLSCYVAQ